LAPAVLAQQPAGNGDLNADGTVLDIVDLVYAVNYMFQNGPAPMLITPCAVDIGQSAIADSSVLNLHADGGHGPNDGRQRALYLSMHIVDSGLLKITASADIAGYYDTCGIPSLIMLDTVARERLDDTSALVFDTITCGLYDSWGPFTVCDSIGSPGFDHKTGLVYQMHTDPGELTLFLDIFYSGCHHLELRDVVFTATLVAEPD
jgi:hypothetical protein